MEKKVRREQNAHPSDGVPHSVKPGINAQLLGRKADR
jgi:hypothetical protein